MKKVDLSGQSGQAKRNPGPTPRPDGYSHLLKNPLMAAEIVINIKLPRVRSNKHLNGKAVQLSLQTVTPISEVKKILRDKLEIESGNLHLVSEEHGLFEDDKRTLQSYQMRSGYVMVL